MLRTWYSPFRYTKPLNFFGYRRLLLSLTTLCSFIVINKLFWTRLCAEFSTLESLKFQTCVSKWIFNDVVRCFAGFKTPVVLVIAGCSQRPVFTRRHLWPACLELCSCEARWPQLYLDKFYVEATDFGLYQEAPKATWRQPFWVLPVQGQ